MSSEVAPPSYHSIARMHIIGRSTESIDVGHDALPDLVQRYSDHEMPGLRDFP
jgi:hypothetical protein